MMSLHWYELVNPLLDLGIVVHSFLFCLQEIYIWFEQLGYSVVICWTCVGHFGRRFCLGMSRAMCCVSGCNTRVSDSPTPSCPHGLCQAQQLKRDLAKPHNSVGSPWRTNSQGVLGVVRNNLWTLVVQPRRLSKVVIYFLGLFDSYKENPCQSKPRQSWLL